MNKKLCIHGHFYQPPREDSWFGKIFVERSAAPMRHWNARITRESYAPLAWARRLDGQGRIADLMNCYEWISFNVGPTLMLWLERQEPELLERILEADRLSLARWGHGNAIAQVFHHIILPLASELDKELEIEWALADFRRRFGRETEGIWLSECAVDIATLEAVAARGIKFVVLSPHQAKIVRENGEERHVNASSLNYGIPYNIKLPSGKSVAAFFYEAALAQSVAFDGLLSDGEKFWQKIRTVAEAMPSENSLLTLATDGETYGHHFKFGEMALAYVLSQGYAGRDNIELTNFGAYLAAHSPTAEVVLHEPSSWSCAHGVERWRGNCGCSTGGHGGWNQEWRAPLREALNFLKNNVDAYFFESGKKIFKDPRAALLDYGQVLVNRAARKDFLKKHFKCDKKHEGKGWFLLRMQESALASLASCAWFFDDVSRIEPVNAMSFALLTMEIMQRTGGPDIQEEFARILDGARSNVPEEGTGKDIFEKRVLPSRQDAASICLYCYLFAFAAGKIPKPGESELIEFPSLSVRLWVDECDLQSNCSGRAVIVAPEVEDGTLFKYEWRGVLPHPDSGAFVSFGSASLEAKKEGEDALAWTRSGAELAAYLEDYLGITIMRSFLSKQHEDRLQAARQVVSTVRPYEEAQQTENLPQLWSQYAAYIPLAVYLSAVPEESLEYVRRILDDILTDYPARQEARDLLEEAVMSDISCKIKDDDDIAAGLKRVGAVFSHTDWWRLQNALWTNGRADPDYAHTASVLGFRM